MLVILFQIGHILELFACSEPQSQISTIFSGFIFILAEEKLNILSVSHSTHMYHTYFFWWVLFSFWILSLIILSFLCFSFFFLLAHSPQCGSFSPSEESEGQGIKHVRLSLACITELMRVCLRKNCRLELSNREKQTVSICNIRRKTSLVHV